MPNHVTNVITAPKEVIEKIVTVKDGRQVVDFELIVPTPPDVSQDAEPYHVKVAAELALGVGRPHFNDKTPSTFSNEDFSLFIKYLQAWKKYGCFNWYDWNCKYWGTKWNAYQTTINPDGVIFDTAWSAPHPVIEALAEQTNAEFLHEWADEDTGHNVGYRKYSGGVVVEERELSGTNEGYELCFRLKPYKAELYKLVDGAYRYVEE